jgi:hypothetical protein
MQLKKIVANLSENFCVVFDKFVFQNLSKSFNASFKSLVEKIQIIGRSNNGLKKTSKKNKITETILYLQKSVETIVGNIKLFST